MARSTGARRNLVQTSVALLMQGIVCLVDEMLVGTLVHIVVLVHVVGDKYGNKQLGLVDQQLMLALLLHGNFVLIVAISTSISMPLHEVISLIDRTIISLTLMIASLLVRGAVLLIDRIIRDLVHLKAV